MFLTKKKKKRHQESKAVISESLWEKPVIFFLKKIFLCLATELPVLDFCGTPSHSAQKYVIINIKNKIILNFNNFLCDLENSHVLSGPAFLFKSKLLSIISKKQALKMSLL